MRETPQALALFGRVYLGFRPPRTVNSVLIVNGRVAYAGDPYVVEGFCKVVACEEVDVSRGVALPGLIDAHMHLTGLALSSRTLDLKGVKSVEELRSRVREFASRWTGSTIIGRGWDQEEFPDKRMPTSRDIDDVVPDRPTLLIRICGHVGVLNTAALRALGLESSNDPNLDRGPDGSPTGIVRESLLMKVLRELEPPAEEYMGYVRDEEVSVASQGITAVGFINVPLKLVGPIMEDSVAGRATVRKRLYLDSDALELLTALGVPRGFGNDMVKINGVKLFADGSLGARTAYLSEPYSDDQSTRGSRLVTSAQLREVLEKARSLDVAIHAIGDAALDEILGAVEGRPDLVQRLRVEHASVVRDDQLPRMRGLRVAVQPRFALSDSPWLRDRLGDRVRYAYRVRDLIDIGATVGLSTDAPVEPVSPWETIYAAVTALKPSLSIVEALDLYTRGSAEVLGDPELGSLEPGKLGDIVIIDRDPLEASPEEIRRFSVLATYVGGRRVT